MTDQESEQIYRIYSNLLSRTSNPRQGALGILRFDGKGEQLFFPICQEDLPPYCATEDFGGYQVTEAEVYVSIEDDPNHLHISLTAVNRLNEIAAILAAPIEEGEIDEGQLQAHVVLVGEEIRQLLKEL